MKRVFLAIFGLVFLFGLSVKAQSPLDGFDVNVNGSVNAIVVQADGKIIIGGSFSTVNGVARNNIARLNVNRTVDASFNPNANAAVLALLMQGSSKILVGGAFTQIAGEAKGGIAKLELDGTADALFENPGVSLWVRTIALDLNGDILIGGVFDFVGIVPRNNIARLNRDFGQLDMSFDPNVIGQTNFLQAEVRSIGVQFDGKIVIGGKFRTVSGVPRRGLARIDPTTGIADSFNPYLIRTSDISSVIVEPNYKILIAGENIDGFVSKKVARIDIGTGTEDPSFSAVFSGITENPGFVTSIARQPNGKILVGGIFNAVNGQSRNNLVRLNTDGSLDTGFNASNPNNGVICFAVLSSGKILIGGGFTNVSGQIRNRFAGLEISGSLDKTLDLGALDGAVRIIVPQPDGKVIVAGLFTSVLGVSRNRIARINADGTLDTTFNPNPAGAGRIFTVALDATGKIYVGGEFLFIGGQNRQFIARLDPTTGNADSFNPFFSSYVYSIHVDLDNNVLVSGGGSFFPYLERIDSNTGLPDGISPNPNGEIETIAEQFADRKILIAGSFTTLAPDGTPETHNRIARLNPDGTIDTTFNTDIDAPVRAIKLQPDGKILVGGDFTSVNSQTRNYVARLNADGSLDTAFNPNADNGITSITVQSNGKILVTGYFSNIGGVPRNRVARLNEITGAPELLGGTIDEYNPNVSGDVFASAILNDGKILIGGEFSSVGGVSRSNFARLSNDIYAVSELTISQNTIAWQVDGSTPQFSRAKFELSTDDGATYTLLGNGTAVLNAFRNSGKLSPTASTYTLSGLNLPTGQNILIRATSASDGSAGAVEKVQGVFLLAPTAASVSISGRVLTSDGRPLRNAVILLTDANGNSRTVRTGSFGLYHFDEIPTGQTVIINVRSKQFQFEQRVLSISEDLTNVDFTPIDGDSLLKSER